MQVSSKLVYILIFKQIIDLIEDFENIFSILNDQIICKYLLAVCFYQLWVFLEIVVPIHSFIIFLNKNFSCL